MACHIKPRERSFVALILSRDRKDLDGIREKLFAEGCRATLRITCAEEFLAYRKIFDLADHEILVVADERSYWLPFVPVENQPVVEVF